LLTIGDAIRSSYGAGRDARVLREIGTNTGRNLINIIYQARAVLIYVAEIKVHWKLSERESDRTRLFSIERARDRTDTRLERRNGRERERERERGDVHRRARFRD